MAKITLYSVSATGKKAIEKEELGPQATLVLSTLQKSEPVTAKDLTVAVDKTKKLTTKQPTARVVAYYLQSFKADGHVKVTTKNTEAPVAAKKAPAKKAPAKKSAKKSAEAAA